MDSIFRDIRFAARSLLKRPGFTAIVVLTLTLNLIPALSSSKIPRVEYVAMDWRVVLFACGVSIVTAVIFGLVPVIQFWRNDIQSTLKESGRSAAAGTPARQRLRKALVISKVAVAVVLLTGAGLLFRSFVRLLQVDPGFTKENVLALQVFVPRNYDQPEKMIAFFDQSLKKIKSLPGIESAAVIATPPFITLDQDASFNVVGRPTPPQGSEPSAFYAPASSEYLAALNIPVKKGRFFTSFDTARSPQVVVINETMARRYFPNEDPAGQRLDVIFGRTVTRHSGLPAEPRAEMLVPHTQAPSFFLLGLFAVIAWLLATIGIYGSISYSTRQRTNEIGVRIALGAQTRDVLRLVVEQGIGLALVGVLIGLGAAFLLTRAIKSFLFGVSPTDPLTFIAISLLLLLTAFVASLIPARRATKVDPLVALRSE